jgi:hypothetical protein
MFCRVETLSNSLKERLREETLASPLPHVLSNTTFSRDTQIAINKEFAIKGWPPLQYAMTFSWKSNMVQPIHIDGNPPNTIRKCSLNLIVSGGEGCTFKWYDAPYVVTNVSSNGISSWGCNEESAKMIHEEPMHEFSIVKTEVPHRITIGSDTILLCLRVRGNPQLL